MNIPDPRARPPYWAPSTTTDERSTEAIDSVISKFLSAKNPEDLFIIPSYK
jgi:hypothetical protein